MKSLALVFALLAFVASRAVAEDFSVTLQDADPVKRPVSVSGMQPATAPPGAITSVLFLSQKRWRTGSNSHPMSVYAVPRARPNGTWWAIVRINGHCNNAAKGGWLEPCAPKPQPAYCPPPKPRHLRFNVDAPCAPEGEEVIITRNYRPNIQPGMIGGREADQGFQIREGWSETTRWSPQVQVGWYSNPDCQIEDQTCGPGTPPPPPPPGGGVKPGGPPTTPPPGGGSGLVSYK